MNLDALKEYKRQLERQIEDADEDEMIEVYEFYLDLVQGEIHYIEQWSTAQGA